jgi:hypothetical protein
MSRRRKEDEGNDLFAFQDIVTGTTGILIVITLLMSLTIGANRIESVIKGRQSAEAVHQQEESLRIRYEAMQQERDKRALLSDDIDARKAQLCEFLQAEVDALENEKLRDPAKDSQRRLIPPTTASLRNPLTVVAVDQHFELLEDDGTLRRQLSFSLGTVRLQEALLSELKGDRGGFLFLIKPSAFGVFDNIAYLGLREGVLLFPFSYDLIPEDWQVSFR